MKTTVLLIVLVLAFSLACLSCKENLSPNTVTQTKPTENKVAESDTIEAAKKILSKSNVTSVDREEALNLLHTIPTSSKNYNAASALIKDIEKKKYAGKRITPRKPFIGMGYLEFQQSCGATTDSSSYESSRGTIWTLRYEYSSERGKNDCWGTFTFVDDMLNSIYRR